MGYSGAPLRPFLLTVSGADSRRSGLNPQLITLAANGGLTLTHAPLPGSLTTDQRGYARDATCDMGAYEYGASGAAGGAVLSAAPDTEKSSVQLARFATSPRGVGDAPSASAIRPLAFVPPSGQIWRSYYYAGTHLIAVRVEGDPTPANNGLFYLHSDHL